MPKEIIRSKSETPEYWYIYYKSTCNEVITMIAFDGDNFLPA